MLSLLHGQLSSFPWDPSVRNLDLGAKAILAPQIAYGQPPSSSNHTPWSTFWSPQVPRAASWWSIDTWPIPHSPQPISSHLPCLSWPPYMDRMLTLTIASRILPLASSSQPFSLPPSPPCPSSFSDHLLSLFSFQRVVQQAHQHPQLCPLHLWSHLPPILRIGVHLLQFGLRLLYPVRGGGLPLVQKGGGQISLGSEICWLSDQRCR